jgi:hypothetical protein
MANLKLYLITRSKGMMGRDIYREAVVAARNIHDARRIHPNGIEPWEASSDWVKSPEEIDVALLGPAAAGTERGVILSDFFGS